MKTGSNNHTNTQKVFCKHVCVFVYWGRRSFNTLSIVINNMLHDKWNWQPVDCKSRRTLLKNKNKCGVGLKTNISLFFHSKPPSMAVSCVAVCVLYGNVNHEGCNLEIPLEFVCNCLCVWVGGGDISDADRWRTAFWIFSAAVLATLLTKVKWQILYSVCNGISHTGI